MPCEARVLRAVLDTNVVVSSLLCKMGVPARILNGWRAMRLVPVVSPAVLREVREVLAYPRIRNKYAGSAATGGCAS